MRISDWSSDVCSSDLGAFDRMYRAADGWVRIAAPDAPAKIASALEIPEEKLADKDGAIAAIGAAIIDLSREEATRRLNRAGVPSASVRKEIGSAPCRERVCQYV